MKFRSPVSTAAIFINRFILGGMTESMHPDYKGLILPFMPGKRVTEVFRKELSMEHTSFLGPRYEHNRGAIKPEKIRGNCLVSIAVNRNKLRCHFENQIRLNGEKRYIHIHLLFRYKEDRTIEYLSEVLSGTYINPLDEFLN
jgi:hypothetical protein